MQYTISLDLDSSIEANSDEEAFNKANEAIKQGFYNLLIVDRE